MPTLEEIYKAKGFTDADLAVVAPLLNDPRHRQPLEEALGALTTERDSYKKENENWANWHEKDGKPLLALYEKDMADAKAEAAGLKARLELAQKNGFAPPTDAPVVVPTTTPTPAADAPFDPKKHNLVTRDDIATFSNMEGKAIAQAGDLIEEYRYLTGGKSLIDYEYRTQDGRSLRGLSALREEALATKAPGTLHDFAAQKFDFAGKRNTIAEAQKKAAEEAIRTDERAKFIQQYGQPGQGPMLASRDPFIPRARTDDGKMPWDRGTDIDRRRARVENALKTQVTGAPN